MTWTILEIKRIKIRSILRFAFFFHAVIGFFLGLLIAVAWGLIDLFEIGEVLPSFFGKLGEPSLSSILILLTLTASGIGAIGALIWALVTLLYNVVTGLVRGIRLEVLTEQLEKADGGDDDG